MTDLKTHALEQLDNWLHDAIDGDATPQEIYDSIINSIIQMRDYHKAKHDDLLEILSLLKGHRPINFDTEPYQKDGMEMTADGFFIPVDTSSTNKKKTWILPVEEVFDDDKQCYEYGISFPDDLLEQAGLSEGDMIDWIDNGDGSYIMKKVNK